jgi:hypothetical protein
MFRNAEYRLSLSESLRQVPALPGSDEALANTSIEGKIRVKTENGSEYEVDADAYVSELRAEVEKLKGALVQVEREQQEKAESDLLSYVRSLPAEEMEMLSESISPDVQEAMKLMISTLFASMGIEPDGLDPALVQNSGDALAKICFWQLISGYTLREMELKDQLDKGFRS